MESFVGYIHIRYANLKRYFDTECSVKKLLLIFLSSCVLWYYIGARGRKDLREPCQFQKVPFSSSVMETLKLEKEVKCNVWNSFVYFDNTGHLHLNHSAIFAAGFNQSQITCEYAIVLMDGFHGSKLVDKTILTKPTYVPNDFVYVVCKTLNRKTVYANFHYNVNTEINKRELLPDTQDQLNIVLLGIDSTSRFLAEKQLPKTLDFFENTLEAYPLKGYTRIGDNTLPNIIAALTGKTLVESVLSTSGYPSLYKEILKRKYIDCFSEDWAPFLPPHLVKYPNYTHYLRSIVVASKQSEFKMFQQTFNNNTFEMQDEKLCFGNNFKHNIVLDYGKQCIEKYKNKRKYPHIHRNLKYNAAQLTTPFDLHETLLDIFTQNFKEQIDFTDNCVLPRGISLFRKIPSRRSCYDASIVENYCPCYSYQPINVEDKVVQKSAIFIVSKINEMLSKSPFSCKTLGLIKVVSAKIQRIPQNSNTNQRSSVRYVVVFKTFPGYGMFEASVEYSHSNEAKLIGNIDRINSYGNQSRCVSEQLDIAYTSLRQYCYCA
ncbi:unnamed protein product [Mytilus edulis]|uniref:Uncharacterized protein n=1 Tax=Mytilus edulis TaxID=6550 RepID=A0A8S3SQ02_MYTED|nr:unnamed protein product [Mytilus edulis]